MDETAQLPERVVDIEERTWLPRHTRGDPKAFAELLEAYRDPVYGYLVRCGVESPAREDLFQEVFLKIHNASASYQPTLPLRPWIFTIVANTVRNHFRARHKRAEEALEVSAEVPDPSPEIAKLVELRSTVDWLEQALGALPMAQREVLLLCVVQGLRQQEVAQVLQVPLNTVKTHLRRGRLALAGALVRRERGAEVFDAPAGDSDAVL